MQHETALDLHRTAEHHRAAIQLRHGVRRIVNDFKLEIDAIEQDIHGHVGRLVDDDAERAVLIVLAQIHHGASENRVQHRGHCYQKMIGQVELGSQFGGLVGACSKIGGFRRVEGCVGGIGGEGFTSLDHTRHTSDAAFDATETSDFAASSDKAAKL